MKQNWEMIPLKEILTERQEIPSNESLISSEISIIAKIAFNDGKIQLRIGNNTKTGMILIKPGDLVVSGINAAKGAIAIYGKENTKPIAATIHYGAYILNQERADIQYLWLLLRSRTFQDLLLQYVPGGIKTELKSKRLLPIPIPLPPLDEQRRIVARIEEVAATVEEARGLRRQSAKEVEYLESQAIETCFQNLLTQGIKSYPFEKLCNRITVGHVSSMRHAYQETGIPFLRSQNVRKNRFEPEGLCFIGVDFHEANQKSALKPGNIVIVRTGFVGVACVIPESLKVANCADLVIVKPNLSLLDSYYASHFLNSVSGKERAVAASVGSAQKHYNVGAMRKTLIPVPSLPEQHRIVAYLDSLQSKVDALKRLPAETAAELDALLPSILDKAFKGEL
jgi:type I restriction enzyme S subunit